KAAEDMTQVATLPAAHLLNIKQELELTASEWARLQAGLEADAFLRIVLYHNYPLEEAANKANAIFASTLKDRLTAGGQSEHSYAQVTRAEEQATPRRRLRSPGRVAKISQAVPTEANEIEPENPPPAPRSVGRPRKRVEKSSEG